MSCSKNRLLKIFLLFLHLAIQSHTQPPFYKAKEIPLEYACQSIVHVSSNSFKVGCLIDSVTWRILTYTQGVKTKQQILNVYCPQIYFSNFGNIFTTVCNYQIRVYQTNGDGDFVQVGQAGFYFNNFIASMSQKKEKLVVVVGNDNESSVCEFLNQKGSGVCRNSTYQFQYYIPTYISSDGSIVISIGRSKNYLQQPRVYIRAENNQFYLSQILPIISNELIISQDNSIIYFKSGTNFCIYKRRQSDKLYQKYVTDMFTQSSSDNTGVLFSTDMKYIYYYYDATLDIYKFENKLIRIQTMPFDEFFSYRQLQFLISSLNSRFYTMGLKIDNNFSYVFQYFSCSEGSSQNFNYLISCPSQKLTPIKLTIALTVPLYVLVTILVVFLVVTIKKFKKTSSIFIYQNFDQSKSARQQKKSLEPSVVELKEIEEKVENNND